MPEITRSGVLRGALAFGGAVTAGGALLGGPGMARSASAEQDARILRYILDLERLEVGFYDAAQRGGALRGELAEFAQIVGGQEREHVAFLERALGSAAGQAPRFDLAAAVRDERTFAGNAVFLEDSVVAGYNGQAANLTNEALADAATIVSVEARHAAWVRDILGQNPAADAVDEARTEEEVRGDLRERGLLG